MNLDLLDPKMIVLAAAVIVIVALLVWLYVRRRRLTTAGLRQKFGSEYDRAVLAHGSERKAESKLEDREKRVEKLVAIPYPISINVPPTFLLIIPEWWRTTALRMRLHCVLGKTRQPRKI